MAINGGSEYTTSTTVTVSTDTSQLPSDFGTPTYMSLSTSAAWTPSWQTFSSSKTFTLPTGDGSKTVYGAFKNSSGYVVQHGSLSGYALYDSIVLDTQPPVLEILTPGLANGTTVKQTYYTVDWNATDAGMGVDHYEIKLDSAAWTPVGALKSNTFNLAEGSHDIYIKAVDKTGKASQYMVTVNVAIPVGTFPVKAEPTVKEVKKGETAVFTATASGGSEPYTYQWFEDTSPISGETSSSLSIQKNSEGNYVFFCNVTDKDGSTGQSNTVTLIIQTEQPPQQTPGSVVINGNAQRTNSTSITLELGASGAVQMCFSNNNVDWSNWEAYQTRKDWALEPGDGTKTVYVKFKDSAGTESAVYQDSITLETPVQEAAPFPTTTVVAIVLGVVVAVVVIFLVRKFLKRPKKPEAPAQLRITAEPSSLVADGETKSVITLQLLDKKGRPIPAIADTQVKVSAAKGLLKNPVVTIPKGRDQEKTLLVSSTESGPVPLTADVSGLQSISVTLNFVEKPRFCMHCGKPMPRKAEICPNPDCRKAPPSGGTARRTCPKCGFGLPEAAKYCSECGSWQPVQQV
jgi:hypothetical protein